MTIFDLAPYSEWRREWRGLKYLIDSDYPLLRRIILNCLLNHLLRVRQDRVIHKLNFIVLDDNDRSDSTTLAEVWTILDEYRSGKVAT